jgi:hypothetical protein
VDGQSQRNGGIVLAVIGAVATAGGAGWIAWEATHPPQCAKSSDPLNLSTALCEAFSGTRYLMPTVVTLTGVGLGITGGVLWYQGEQRMARSQLILRPRMVGLALAW